MGFWFCRAGNPSPNRWHQTLFCTPFAFYPPRCHAFCMSWPSYFLHLLARSCHVTPATKLNRLDIWKVVSYLCLLMFVFSWEEKNAKCWIMRWPFCRLHGKLHGQLSHKWIGCFCGKGPTTQTFANIVNHNQSIIKHLSSSACFLLIAMLSLRKQPKTKNKNIQKQSQTAICIFENNVWITVNHAYHLSDIYPYLSTSFQIATYAAEAEPRRTEVWNLQSVQLHQLHGHYRIRTPPQVSTESPATTKSQTRGFWTP